MSPYGSFFQSSKYHIGHSLNLSIDINGIICDFHPTFGLIQFNKKVKGKQNGILAAKSLS